jgi:hypothetical protein
MRAAFTIIPTVGIYVKNFSKSLPCFPQLFESQSVPGTDLNEKEYKILKSISFYD